jgi:lysyl-tRNA synthetase class 2
VSQRSVRPEVLELVRRHGDDTLSFFKLRDDLEHLIATGGEALIGYAVLGGVLLVAGDPVGPPDALPPLLARARTLARQRRLRLAVLGASVRTRPALEAAGLRCLYVGDEAIVETEAFSTRGTEMRRLRKPALRLQREGHTIEVRRLGDLAEAELAELEALAARALGRAPERSFAWAMDTLRGAHQADTVVVVGRDPAGATRGLLHLVPSHGRPAWSVSMMRRDPSAANGLMDVLVLEAIAAASAADIAELSLNFAAFSRWLREPHGRLEHAGGRAVRVASRYVQMESLLRFNAKFRPRWDERFLAYEGRLGFARAGLAALRIEGQLHHGLRRGRDRLLN